MKKIVIVTVFMLLVGTSYAQAHCEIPCGIYTDQMRIDMIEEDAKTIRKSMEKIQELSKEGDKNYNQLIRWVDNKETHANKVQEIVYQYFMTQRIKPADMKEKEAYDKYIKEITLLHKMLRAAMKAKQTTDFVAVDDLEDLLAEFEQSYIGADKHTHKPEAAADKKK